MSQETQWYVSQEEEQLGPYTGEQMLSFAQGGNITRQSMVWAEGMPEWLPAEQIDGLFPAAVAAAGPVRAAPATARPAPARAVATQPGSPARGGTATVARPTQPGSPARGGTATVARPTQAPTQSGQPTARGQGTQPQGSNGAFPRPPVPVASFGMFAGSIAMTLILPLIGVGVLYFATTQPHPDPALGIVMLACFVAGGVCLLLGLIFGMINLYRAWLCLSRTGGSVSPGMAVGLLFVPFFSFYWIFRAFYGFAQEWNRLTHYYEDTRRGPKMSEGLFLAFCICILIFPPLGLILIFPVMSSLCTAINFIARRPLQARGPVRPR
jgi:hypothetical protein